MYIIKKISTPLLLLFYFSSLSATTLEEVGGNISDVLNIIPAPDLDNKIDRNSIEAINGGGLSSENYAVQGSSFYALREGFERDATGKGDLRCDSSSTTVFVDHEIKMEEHDVLQWLDVWGKDTHASDNMSVILYRQCLPAFGSSAMFQEYNLIEEMNYSSGDFLYTRKLSRSYKGLLRNCKLMARVRFTNDPSFTSCTNSNALSLYKLRVQLVKNDVIFKDGLSLY